MERRTEKEIQVAATLRKLRQHPKRRRRTKSLKSSANAKESRRGRRYKTKSVEGTVYSSASSLKGSRNKYAVDLDDPDVKKVVAFMASPTDPRDPMDFCLDEDVDSGRFKRIISDKVVREAIELEAQEQLPIARQMLLKRLYTAGLKDPRLAKQFMALTGGDTPGAGVDPFHKFEGLSDKDLDEAIYERLKALNKLHEAKKWRANKKAGV